MRLEEEKEGTDLEALGHSGLKVILGDRRGFSSVTGQDVS